MTHFLKYLENTVKKISKDLEPELQQISKINSQTG